MRLICDVSQQYRCSDIHWEGRKRESNDSQHPLMGQIRHNMKALKTTAWNGTIYSNRLSNKTERGQKKTGEQTDEESEELRKCFSDLPQCPACVCAVQGPARQTPPPSWNDWSQKRGAQGPSHRAAPPMTAQPEPTRTLPWKKSMREYSAHIHKVRLILSRGGYTLKRINFTVIQILHGFFQNKWI